MDFYRINEEYNKFLQRYEKEKRGVTKVPNIRYTDRKQILTDNSCVFHILEEGAGST